MAAPEVRGTLLSFARPPGCFAGLLLGELDSALYRPQVWRGEGGTARGTPLCVSHRLKCPEFGCGALDSKSSREQVLSI